MAPRYRKQGVRSMRPFGQLRQHPEARLRRCRSARLKDVTGEEMAGQFEARQDIGDLQWRALRAFEKLRKAEKLVAIGFSGAFAHRPARSRRHIDQIFRAAGDRAATEIEPKAQLIEKPELPT